MITLQEQTKSLVIRYLDEVWRRNKIAAVDDLLAPDYKCYLSPVSEPLNLDGQKQRLTGLRAIFPDVQIKMEDIFAEVDRVAFRSTMRGTHLGIFQGNQPTGRRVTVLLLDVIRFEDGISSNTGVDLIYSIY